MLAFSAMAATALAATPSLPFAASGHAGQLSLFSPGISALALGAVLTVQKTTGLYLSTLSGGSSSGASGLVLTPQRLDRHRSHLRRATPSGDRRRILPPR